MNGRDRRQDILFPCHHLKANALVLIHRQEVVHDFKARLPFRVVDGSDIDQGREPGIAICLDEFDEAFERRLRNSHRQFAEGNLPRHHAIRALCGNVFGQFGQGFAHDIFL